jgi:hypothetical protein
MGFCLEILGALWRAGKFAVAFAWRHETKKGLACLSPANLGESRWESRRFTGSCGFTL